MWRGWWWGRGASGRQRSEVRGATAKKIRGNGPTTLSHQAGSAGQPIRHFMLTGNGDKYLEGSERGPRGRHAEPRSTLRHTSVLRISRPHEITCHTTQTDQGSRSDVGSRLPYRIVATRLGIGRCRDFQPAMSLIKIRAESSRVPFQQPTAFLRTYELQDEVDRNDTHICITRPSNSHTCNSCLLYIWRYASYMTVTQQSLNRNKD